MAPIKSSAVDYTDKDMKLLFGMAKKVIKEEGRCSFALLQRKLKTGYIRTLKILNMLEEKRVIVKAGDMKWKIL